MKCRILNESKNRIRVHFAMQRMSCHQADIAEAYFSGFDFIDSVKAYDRTADVVICYSSDRKTVIDLLAAFSYELPGLQAIQVVSASREIQNEYEEKLVMTVLLRYLKKIFLPMPIRIALVYIKMVKYIIKALKSLAKGKLEVSVLDATAITVSVIRGDFSTASDVMFLLKIGEILEEWTHKKAIEDLAGTMSLDVDNVWLSDESGEEKLVPVTDIKPGDNIVLRRSDIIPLDGKVVSGTVTVNQASMTGESQPVEKNPDGIVFAGTVVDSGECIIEVTHNSGSGRYDRIVQMIENSEKLKSDAEAKANHLADKLVPYSLGGTLAVYLLTRNVTKALSILMVDFSCALKLAMPVSVLSAINECRKNSITVKGGMFLEAVAEADTIVFDKTGTLTCAQPRVAGIITFGDNDADEMLRLAACLEEHFPHSVANAVIRAAKEKNLDHEEKHSKVDYIVAHGIASIIDDKRVVIGSYHFVFEDEGCIIPEVEKDKFDSAPDNCSHLYMAISGELVSIICIEDPLKDGVMDIVESLHSLGITKAVMMTGDSERTAKSVAEKTGIDEYYAEVMPEDKAEFIRKEHSLGRKVIMIGDGVNDSPALSEADAGIAISTGAAIAREISDITINSEDLEKLVFLRRLSMALMGRINRNYRDIVTINGTLIGLGVLGIIQPSLSALLHNASTLAIALKSTTKLIDK